MESLGMQWLLRIWQADAGRASSGCTALTRNWGRAMQAGEPPHRQLQSSNAAAVGVRHARAGGVGEAAWQEWGLAASGRLPGFTPGRSRPSAEDGVPGVAHTVLHFVASAAHTAEDLLHEVCWRRLGDAVVPVLAVARTVSEAPGAIRVRVGVAAEAVLHRSALRVGTHVAEAAVLCAGGVRRLRSLRQGGGELLVPQHGSHGVLAAVHLPQLLDVQLG
mmetsp:Transcript_70921/g.220048  ORF Transcript_70921/g.220048 Transcript_70921/m.220048 type:complete len:219 (+) Transcript_70921:110-766(+)